MTDKQLDTLIADIKTSIARTHDLVLKLEAQVTGQNPVRDVIAFWCNEWKHRYAANYDVTKGDAGQFKRLVTANGLGEMKQRIARYLNDHDRFIVQNKHPLSFFFKRVSGYATPEGRPAHWQAMEDDTEPGPIDCHHEPPCRTESEHTTKKLRELRA